MIARAALIPPPRLRRITSGGVITDWLWDGDHLVAEYDGAGSVTIRYLHGPGPDEPLFRLAPDGSYAWFMADQQGSIIAETGYVGYLAGTPYTYSPYGEPDTTHGYGGPRFRFTGQMAPNMDPSQVTTSKTLIEELNQRVAHIADVYEDNSSVIISLHGCGKFRILHDAYGMEYSGYLKRSLFSKKTGLIQAAGRVGINTQFMYHDDISHSAVIGQIADMVILTHQASKKSPRR